MTDEERTYVYVHVRIEGVRPEIRTRIEKNVEYKYINVSK